MSPSTISVLLLASALYAGSADELQLTYDDVEARGLLMCSDLFKGCRSSENSLKNCDHLYTRCNAACDTCMEVTELCFQMRRSYSDAQQACFKGTLKCFQKTKKTFLRADRARRSLVRKVRRELRLE